MDIITLATVYGLAVVVLAVVVYSARPTMSGRF